MSRQDDQDALAHPVFNAARLAELAGFGQERPVEAGHVLFDAGERTQDLFILLEGAAEAVRRDRDTDVVVVEFKQGRLSES